MTVFKTSRGKFIPVQCNKISIFSLSRHEGACREKESREFKLSNAHFSLFFMKVEDVHELVQAGDKSFTSITVLSISMMLLSILQQMKTPRWKSRLLLAATVFLLDMQLKSLRLWAEKRNNFWLMGCSHFFMRHLLSQKTTNWNSRPFSSIKAVVKRRK